MRSSSSLLAFGLTLTLALPAAAQDPSYVKDVRPFLDKYCVNCHQGAKAKAGVRIGAAEFSSAYTSSSAVGFVTRRTRFGPLP